MNKFTGCFSRLEIESFIPPKDSVLVCIYDPEPAANYPKVSRSTQGWRFISFHDFWDTEPTKPDRVRFPRLAGLMPEATPQDIARIKETIDAFYEGHNIFVSCEAGISRSAAVREYLLRKGWTCFGREQQNRMVHPNAYILATLQKMDKEYYH